MNNKVLITGLGAITSLGNNLNETYENILAGRDGISEITNWDISGWSSRLGGEIKNLDIKSMLPDRKLLKVISRHDILGIYAASSAINHSELLSYRETLTSSDEFNDKTGIYVGSPGNKFFQQYDFLPLLAKSGDNLQNFGENLSEEVHPMWLLKTLPNNVLAYTGIYHGFKGNNHNIANHAAGGMQALIEAYHAIRTGQIERAVVVAYDVGSEPQALYYYQNLGVISAKYLKPFDYQHDGTILAEGAGAIVLESEQSAKERNANIFGEFVGGASHTEGGGLFSLDITGAPLTGLLQKTLEKHQIKPCEIGLITAHGNGNTKSDISEARAIQETFGMYGVAVTGFKWATGHTLCASGVLDVVLTVSSMNNNCIPGIANFEHPSLECETLNVCKINRERQINSALVINRGFAGINSCVVLKSCD